MEAALAASLVMLVAYRARKRPLLAGASAAPAGGLSSPAHARKLPISLVPWSAVRNRGVTPASIARLFVDGSVAKFTLRIPHPYTLDDAEWWLANAGAVAEDFSSGNWAIFEVCAAGHVRALTPRTCACTQGDQLVGGISLEPVSQDAARAHVRGIGYYVAPEARGRGIASRAVSTLLSNVVNPAVTRVEANVFAGKRACFSWLMCLCGLTKRISRQPTLGASAGKGRVHMRRPMQVVLRQGRRGARCRIIRQGARPFARAPCGRPDCVYRCWRRPFDVRIPIPYICAHAFTFVFFYKKTKKRQLICSYRSCGTRVVGRGHGPCGLSMACSAVPLKKTASMRSFDHGTPPGLSIALRPVVLARATTRSSHSRQHAAALVASAAPTFSYAFISTGPGTL